MNTVASRHFSKVGASRRSKKLNENMVKMYGQTGFRSSGWKRIDYSYRATHKFPYRYEVVARSL